MPTTPHWHTSAAGAGSVPNQAQGGHASSRGQRDARFRSWLDFRCTVSIEPWGPIAFARYLAANYGTTNTLFGRCNAVDALQSFHGSGIPGSAGGYGIVHPLSAEYLIQHTLEHSHSMMIGDASDTMVADMLLYGHKEPYQ